ncbi:MAG: CoA ester lyase [Archaeoglobus sp.]|nr:CoA ester lyase [Archaeoglobus sp.]
MKVLRSILFVPGNNMRMITKACTLPADAVALDLEDAVPLSEKETARIFIKDSIKMVKNSGTTVIVRVNGWSTGLLEEDLEAVVCEGLDCIMLPKAESKEDVTQLDLLLTKLERERNLEPNCLGIIPTIETAEGVINAWEIATASQRNIAITFGAVDYTRDLGVSPSKEGIEIFYPRAYVCVVARAAKISAIDTVFTDLIDRKGLEEDCKLAKQLGYSGKNVIHPTQIEFVNKIFTPSQEEVKWAKKVVPAFEAASRKGLGAISVDGKMVDLPVYEQAKNILALIEAIKEIKSKKGDIKFVNIYEYY